MSFQRAEQPVTLKGHEAARAFLEPCVMGDRTGSWWVAHVDEWVRCIHLAPYAAGEGTGPLPVGAILGDACRLGSAGLLLARSIGTEADQEGRAGRQLARAAEALDATVLDQLLFSDEGCLSMRRAGLL